MAYSGLFLFGGSSALDSNYFIFQVASPDDFIIADMAALATSPGHSGSSDKADREAGFNVDGLFSLGSGIPFLSTEFLRITDDGLIQVDLNGGGDEWVTVAALEAVQNNGIVHAGGSGPIGLIIAAPNSHGHANAPFEGHGSHFLPWLMSEVGAGWVEASQPFVI